MIIFQSGSQEFAGRIFVTPGWTFSRDATTGLVTIQVSGSGGGGVTDHGSLTGLDAADHPEYLLVSGTRQLIAPWNAGNAITATDLIGTGSQIVGIPHANLTGLENDEHPEYLLVSGTRPLVGNWNAFFAISSSFGFSGSGAGLSDISHSALFGLEQDDHTQYLLADGTRALSGPWNAGDAITATDLIGTGSGIIGMDHGQLAGLEDDDHPEYLLASGTRPLNANWNAAYAITSSLGFKGEGSQLENVPPYLVGSGVVSSSTQIDHGSIQGLEDEDHPEYLLVSGTRPLLDNWNAFFAVSSSVGFKGDGSQITGVVSSSYATTASYALNAGVGGVTDHGALTGLDDDDHPEYLSRSGSKALVANWNAGYAITSSLGFKGDGSQLTNIPTDLDGTGVVSESVQFPQTSIFDVRTLSGTVGLFAPTLASDASVQIGIDANAGSTAYFRVRQGSPTAGTTRLELDENGNLTIDDNLYLGQSVTGHKMELRSDGTEIMLGNQNSGQNIVLQVSGSDKIEIGDSINRSRIAGVDWASGTGSPGGTAVSGTIFLRF